MSRINNKLKSIQLSIQKELTELADAKESLKRFISDGDLNKDLLNFVLDRFEKTFYKSKYSNDPEYRDEFAEYFLNANSMFTCYHKDSFRDNEHNYWFRDTNTRNNKEIYFNLDFDLKNNLLKVYIECYLKGSPRKIEYRSSIPFKKENDFSVSNVDTSRIKEELIGD